MLVFFILCPGILSIILSLAALQKVKCHIRCQEEEAENYSWNIPKKSLQNFRKYLLEGTVDDFKVQLLPQIPSFLNHFNFLPKITSFNSDPPSYIQLSGRCCLVLLGRLGSGNALFQPCERTVLASRLEDRRLLPLSANISQNPRFRRKHLPQEKSARHKSQASCPENHFRRHSENKLF